MSISSNNYVRIISAVAGGETLPTQALHARRFSTNPLVPAGSVLEFDKDSALEYFGATSREAVDIMAYFGYTSPAPASSPSRIQFSAWVNADRSPTIYGQRLTATLAELKLVTAGTLSLSLGDGEETFSAISFASATSLSDVASALQTKLRTGTGPQFAAATVVYDSARGSFVVAGSVAENAVIEVTAGALADQLGLTGNNAIYSNGADAQTTLEAYTTALSVSDNYGAASFRWPTGYVIDVNADVIPVAQYVASENGVHRMDWAVMPNDVATWAPLVANIGYNSWNEVSSGNPVELMPGAITAATNFNRRNGAPGYMYRQNGNLKATVFDDTRKAFLDARKVNYIGRTMSAGTNVDFYQMGVLTGGAVDPEALNVQTNEMWLKARCKSVLLNLQLSSNILASNTDGEAAITAVLSGGPISEAVTNGVISIGKRLTALQEQAIYAITGDSLAAIQVGSTGWWLSVRAQGNLAEYTLVYAVADQIRKIEGSHNLI